MENHCQDEVLSKNQITDPETVEPGIHIGSAVTADRFAWETLLRSTFLVFVTGAIVMLAWRPGISRLNFALVFGSPNRGERLAWAAVDDPPVRRLPASGSPQPPEWRLTANHFKSWHNPRYTRTRLDLTSKSIAETVWRRETNNAWKWEDDVRPEIHRDPAGQPSQLPMTSFRASDLPEWPRPAVEKRDEPELFPALPMIDQPATQPPLPSLPSTAAVPAQTAVPQSMPAPGAAVPLEPPALPPVPTRRDVEPARPAQPEIPILLDGSAQSPRPTATPGMSGEKIDWKNREITGPIQGAFLTIYPKLKFVGLCLPDQGYIRSYHQIGVPEHPEGEKMSAHDGRIPYGRYYIADRYRDADGPRLFLSWPSPEDGRRIGLDPARQAEVENAWRRRELPPQDTPAGGGVGITGLRRWVEVTEGGFALEEPQMEEIFTALPDKAWVIIQND